MQDEPAASLVLRALSRCRTAAAISVAALALVAAVASAAAMSADRIDARQGQTTAPESSDGAGIFAFMGLPPRFDQQESREYAAILRFTDVSSWTPTPVPPTATPVPPSPTPVPPTVAPRRPQQAAPPASGVERPAPLPPAPTATPAPPPPPPAPAGLDTRPMDGLSQALFDATNRRRVASGLSPLRLNLALVGIARIRSNEMAQYNYFAHESPVTGHTAFSLMDLYGVPYAWAGENLAKNNYNDTETVGVADQALWDSQGHRDNILGAHYTDMGIALAVDGSGMKYFTIIFTGP
jgi:uncharacterized protein YkwD